MASSTAKRSLTRPPRPASTTVVVRPAIRGPARTTSVYFRSGSTTAGSSTRIRGVGSGVSDPEVSGRLSPQRRFQSPSRAMSRSSPAPTSLRRSRRPAAPRARSRTGTRPATGTAVGAPLHHDLTGEVVVRSPRRGPARAARHRCRSSDAANDDVTSPPESNQPTASAPRRAGRRPAPPPAGDRRPHRRLIGADLPSRPRPGRARSPDRRSPTRAQRACRSGPAPTDRPGRSPGSPARPRAPPPRPHRRARPGRRPRGPRSRRVVGRRSERGPTTACSDAGEEPASGSSGRRAPRPRRVPRPTPPARPDARAIARARVDRRARSAAVTSPSR